MNLDQLALLLSYAAIFGGGFVTGVIVTLHFMTK